MKRRRNNTRHERWIVQVLEDHKAVMDLSPHEVNSRMPCRSTRRPPPTETKAIMRGMDGVWYNGDGRWYMAPVPRPATLDKDYCPYCGRTNELTCHWSRDREVRAGLVPFHVYCSNPARAVMLEPAEIVEVIEDHILDDDEIEFEEDVAAELERRYDQWKRDLAASKRWDHLHQLVAGVYLKPASE